MPLTANEANGPTRRNAHLALGFILFASLVLNAFPLWWGLPNYISWAYDEIHPHRVQAPENWPAYYPPFHGYVLKVVYLPFEALRSAGILKASNTEFYNILFLAGRCLSVFMSTGTVYLVYRCSRELYGRSVSILAALSAALNPSFVYYAKTVNLDVPYVFWFSASLLFYLKTLRHHRMRDYLLFSILAVLSIGTKDQAFALYLASPIPLLASLAACKRRQDRWPRRLLAAMLDRRVVAAGAVAITLFVLIHRIFPDPAVFLRHVNEITGPASDLRVFPSSLQGQLRMAIKGLEHLAFCLSYPILIAACCGMVLAIRFREDKRSLSLLFLVAGYYLSLISILGYHFVRFFLPVCIICAIFAGRALAELARMKRPSPGVGPPAVALVMLYAFLRALSTDLLMSGDARYPAERWLRSATEQQIAYGFGSREMVPRGTTVVSWKRLKDRECRVLAALTPRFVVFNSNDLIDDERQRIFSRFMRGEINYELARRHRQRPAIDLLDLTGIATNLKKISREVVVFERTEGACIGLADVTEDLLELQSSGDPELRTRLTETILGQRFAHRRLLGGEHMVAVGVSRDLWTQGTAPAAVAIRNSSDARMYPKLTVTAHAPEEVYPMTLRIDDGEAARAYLFVREGGREIQLAPVSPGDERLFVLWSDKAWQPKNNKNRWLGVRLVRLDDSR